MRNSKCIENPLKQIEMRKHGHVLKMVNSLMWLAFMARCGKWGRAVWDEEMKLERYSRAWEWIEFWLPCQRVEACLVSSREPLKTCLSNSFCMSPGSNNQLNGRFLRMMEKSRCHSGNEKKVAHKRYGITMVRI